MATSLGLPTAKDRYLPPKAYTVLKVRPQETHDYYLYPQRQPGSQNKSPRNPRAANPLNSRSQSLVRKGSQRQNVRVRLPRGNEGRRQAATAPTFLQLVSTLRCNIESLDRAPKKQKIKRMDREREDTRSTNTRYHGRSSWILEERAKIRNTGQWGLLSPQHRETDRSAVRVKANQRGWGEHANKQRRQARARSRSDVVD